MLASDAFPFFQERLKTTPGNYLEIGSFNGDFVGKLARQFPEKTFYCIDPFLEDGCTSHLTEQPKGDRVIGLQGQFLRNTRECKNVILFQQTSKEFYAAHHVSFFNSLGVTTILIDGDHRFDHVVNDLYLAMDLIAGRPKAFVYLDDYNMSDVRKAADFFCEKWGTMITATVKVKLGGLALELDPLK